MEEGRSALKVSSGTPTGNRSLLKPSRRWDDNFTVEWILKI
jgi:hypothetical protein